MKAKQTKTSTKAVRFLIKWQPADNYMFKVKTRNTRTRCEIRSKFTIKTPERRPIVSTVNFEQVNAGWKI